MNKLASVFCGAAALFTVLLSGGCSEDAVFAGRWRSVTPVSITQEIDGASNATSLLTIDFAEAGDRRGGKVEMTGDVDIAWMEAGDVYSGGKPYRLQVRAKATCNGTWIYDMDDHDEILLSLNVNDMKVDLDPADLVFPAYYANSVPAEKLDSVKLSAADNMRHEVSRVMSAEFLGFSVIEDMETDKDRKVLSFETRSPERDYHFVRVGR